MYDKRTNNECYAFQLGEISGLYPSVNLREHYRSRHYQYIFRTVMVGDAEYFSIRILATYSKKMGEPDINMDVTKITATVWIRTILWIIIVKRRIGVKKSTANSLFTTNISTVTKIYYWRQHFRKPWTNMWIHVITLHHADFTGEVSCTIWDIAMPQRLRRWTVLPSR